MATSKEEQEQLRRTLFPEEYLEVTEQPRNEAKDPLAVAWAWKGITHTWESKRYNPGHTFRSTEMRMPQYKLYMLAIAQIQSEGRIATTSAVHQLIGTISRQVVNRTLRYMSGNFRHHRSDESYNDWPWPISRIKHGRTYRWYINEPGPDPKHRVYHE